ncbi:MULTISPECIES: M13 family metallopeptidase [unclassified Arthrobacter]|uniref:M13 family metallopeptidase n=1 Tax=unclassified Arthrobacter TaxID=235627 RepID=UPI001490B9CE|nr:MULTISPECIES: M13-type metalloendopeptidase [unclassified Arthrobacter]MBE0009775.1 M13 family peptidase [Arthrobacter sp. AET 35A]NOJ63725.1 peptidase M13 [Arthrobacter sp. 147(2020)]
MASAGTTHTATGTEVRVQDDLFRHVNGGWLSTTDIPSDRPLEGAFTQLRDAAELAVRQIIEDAAATPDPSGDNFKIKALYGSFMNEVLIERAGAEPVAPLLERIDAVESTAALVTLDAELSRTGIAGLALPYVSNDAGNPERYMLHLYQSGLGMPDESYYREDKFDTSRTEYRALLVALLREAGVDDAEGRAAAVFDLETKLAAAHMDTVTRRDPQATYNLLTLDAVVELAPFSGQWLKTLTRNADGIDELIVSQPEYLAAVDSLLASVDLEVWKSWLTTRVLLHSAGYLSRAFVDAAFAFYGTHLSGTPQIKDRWKRGVALVEGAVGEAVGREYVNRHFPPTHKAIMLGLVENLLAAYRESITSLDWMTSATKERALAKLEQFHTKIGFPDQWIDYSELEIIDGDTYGNVRRATAFELDRQLARLGGPIDRGNWLMTPQTVNAYYMPTMNEIVFPAAILQPPFFDVDADPAVNYGAIGAVIGHEIGHGFDDKGSQFDGSGRLDNWWTDQDRAAFDALTARLVEQYDQLSPAEAPGNTVNGNLTLGENIGDLGGLSIGYRAYLLSLDGAEPPVIDGLTGAQRFFTSWAQCWRQKIRAEEALRRLTVDPHSPNEFRCNQVVRNLDPFHDAFGVTEADQLWLEPDQRVRIW